MWLTCALPAFAQVRSPSLIVCPFYALPLRLSLRYGMWVVERWSIHFDYNWTDKSASAKQRAATNDAVASTPRKSLCFSCSLPTGSRPHISSLPAMGVCLHESGRGKAGYNPASYLGRTFPMGLPQAQPLTPTTAAASTRTAMTASCTRHSLLIQQHIRYWKSERTSNEDKEPPHHEGRPC